MQCSAIYPGTFDPVTNGHIDLVARASSIFDRVITAIAVNNGKNTLFNIDERVAFMRQVVGRYSNVEVIGFNNLLVECAIEQGATVILRGLRAVSDFEYEFQLAGMNRHLSPKLETMFMTPDEKYAFISSGMIREIAGLGGDVSAFVPSVICSELSKKFN